MAEAKNINSHCSTGSMVIRMVTLQKMYDEIRQLRTEVRRLRRIAEEREISDECKRQLALAREEMDAGKYTDHETMMARYG